MRVGGESTGRTRSARPAALALVTALLLAGCSSEGAAPPAGTSTPTRSATGASSVPGPTPGTTPTAPPPVPGSTGQRAFARHVMDLWAYALRTNDTAPLNALSGARACAGCAALDRDLAARRRQGWAVDFPGVLVRRVSVRRRGDVRVARATVDIPASDSYDTDGRFRNTNPAHPGATFEVQMRYLDGKYRLIAFSVS